MKKGLHVFDVPVHRVASGSVTVNTVIRDEIAVHVLYFSNMIVFFLLRERMVRLIVGLWVIHPISSCAVIGTMSENEQVPKETKFRDVRLLKGDNADMFLGVIFLPDTMGDAVDAVLSY